MATTTLPVKEVYTNFKDEIKRRFPQPQYHVVEEEVEEEVEVEEEDENININDSDRQLIHTINKKEMMLLFHFIKTDGSIPENPEGLDNETIVNMFRRWSERLEDIKQDGCRIDELITYYSSRQQNECYFPKGFNNECIPHIDRRIESIINQIEYDIGRNPDGPCQDINGGGRQRRRNSRRRGRGRSRSRRHPRRSRRRGRGRSRHPPRRHPTRDDRNDFFCE